MQYQHVKNKINSVINLRKRDNLGLNLSAFPFVSQYHNSYIYIGYDDKSVSYTLP